MKKIIKYSIYGLLSLIALVAILFAFIAATFNPNDYKQQIIDLVQAKKQRTLTLDGDIKLTFWPKIGANLGKVAISEHQSKAEFASINSAQVALAVLPLLKKELVVDTVYIDGAKANIVKYKDGTTNFDDLLSKDEDESEAIKFDVQGINISNSAVNYKDEASNANYAISQFNMQSGHIALATPVDLSTNFSIKANQPNINAKVNVKGNFLADPATQHFVVKALDAKIKGDLLSGKSVDIEANGNVDATLTSKEILVDDLKLVASGQFNGAQMQLDLAAPALKALKDEVSSKKITVALAQTKGGDSFKANLTLADMQGSPKAIQSSGISGDFSADQGARHVASEFSSPFKGNLESLIFDLPKLVGNLAIKDPALPNGAIEGDFNLALHSDVKQEKVNSQFALNLDNTKLKGDVAVTSFKTPKIKFNLNADTLDLNKLLGTKQASAKTSDKSNAKPADLSVLKTLFLEGKLNVGSILYEKYRLSGLNVGILANGEKLSLTGLNVKLDDSQIKGNLGISHFSKPLYSFAIDIDHLDADRYIAASPKTETKSDETQAFDLSALKALNADGSLRIGNFKYGKTKATNIRIDLKAADGVAAVSPLSANLYQGSVNGSIKIDARNTPVITINQNLNGIDIGPLLVDTINNDMLTGKGSLNLDVTTTGNNIAALKQTLNGNAALNLADGALKGIDIAGTFRSIKSKLNVLKSQSSVEADAKKKTDFSELTASFNIKNGVAHNEDLAMKAPILRLAKGDSRGDIDIAKQTINYLAKPTVVKSLKGQGGAELDSLAGFPIPIKITGTFADPKYGVDFAAVGKAAAQSQLLDKVAGDKSEAIKGLLGDGNKVDALKGLLGSNKSNDANAAPAAEEPKTKVEQKLKKLLNF